jgi:hypothetical protein
MFYCCEYLSIIIFARCDEAKQTNKTKAKAGRTLLSAKEGLLR